MRLEAIGVEFAYRAATVLRGLDFTAESGDTVAVLGPNGAGKSTLFRCLLGFLKPQRGEIRIDGCDIRKLSAAELAKRMAYIPQSANPAFNYTVQDVVLMGLTNRLGPFGTPGEKDEKEAGKALEKLGISHLRHRGCGQISGGERQLALLARALVQNAGILIMDEPTASLDYGNSQRVMEQIKTLAGSGYTVVFSTHDPNQALMHASRALVIKDGAVLAFGAAREVLDAKLLSRLYGIDVQVSRVTVNGSELPVSLPGALS